MSGGRRTARLVVGAAVAAVIAGRVWLFEPVVVTTPGMAPTVLAGDVVWVWRGLPGGDGAVHAVPGAVVAATMAEGEGLSIDRVVATGGQRVRVEGGRLWVDGVAAGTGERRRAKVTVAECGAVEVGLEEEAHGSRRSWVLPGTSAAEAGLDAAVDVPQGAVFLLGDQRRVSADSRQWGPVPATRVVGTVRRVLWSRDPCTGGLRWGRVGLAVESSSP